MDKNEHKCCHHSPAKKLTTAELAAATGIYICPMDLEVRQEGPGNCPICGMALEPEIATENAQENPELTDFRKRFWIGLVFTLPIMLLEMGGHFTNNSFFISGTNNHLLQFVLSLPVVLWSGAPLFIRCYKSFLQKHLNMFSLISMGTGVAFIYSIIAFLVPSLFPASFHTHEGNVPVYFEAASVIIVLVLLGQILELKARERTGGAIKALLGLAPKSAKIITVDGEIDTLVEDIKIGDKLRIRPGEKIPIDGVITEGTTNIDESMITGEPVPISKTTNNYVIGGTININGSIVIKTTKIGSDTMLANIIAAVSKAQRSRAPIQRLADLVSGWFVPVVIFIAIAALVVWTLSGIEQSFSYGLIACVSVLIIACPCALGLATPMSIMVGIGKGAKNGILIKNAESLEVLEKVNSVIVDKTGTLTEGKPKLSKIYGNEIAENDLLQLAASVEQHSEHPLSSAIIQAAKENNLNMLEIKNFKSLAGKGVVGSIQGKQISFGNKALMEDIGLPVNVDLSDVADESRKLGATVMFLADEKRILGFIAVSDPIKNTTPAAIKTLQRMGIEVVMLTGDTALTAQSVANQLGITHFRADVLPEDKARIVQDYKDKGRVVAMAGDGINDAIALSTANVGIAMGNGTDVAIESADVVVVKGDLLRLSGSINLSRAVMSNIRQNLFLAFAYNMLGVPIAAGVLFPIFGILLSPIFAAIAMALSSISVIGNALRLNLKRLEP